METRQIRDTTIDILLVEEQDAPGKQAEHFLAEALGAGAAPGQGSGRSARQLALGYRVALGCADDKRLESVAFQGIDIHACGCAVPEAAAAAIGAVQEYINSHRRTNIRRILFVEYHPEAYDAFRRALTDLVDPTG